MEKSNAKPVRRTVTVDRNRPIPLAERRRMMRVVEPKEAKPQAITDWASI